MSSSDLDERHFWEKGIVARLTSNTGWGLFADKDFAPGELIFSLDLDDSERANIVYLHESFGECYHRGITVVPGFVFCCTIQHPLWSVNHSCNANSGFINWGRIENHKMHFVAHRKIQRGEQITLDYSPCTARYDGTLDGGPWSMQPCLCGLAHCRQVITGYEALPANLQYEFIKSADGLHGRVLAHILNDLPDLVTELKHDHPLLYAQYHHVLQQQFEFAEYLQYARTKKRTMYNKTGSD
jgi:hypothetical protein